MTDRYVGTAVNCRRISVPASGNLESYYLRKFWDVTLREEEPIDWLPAWCEAIELDPSEIAPEQAHG